MTLIHLQLEGEIFFTKFLLGKELYLSGKTHTYSFLMSEWDRKWYTGSPVYAWGPHAAKGEFYLFIYFDMAQRKRERWSNQDGGKSCFTMWHFTKVTECAMYISCENQQGGQVLSIYGVSQSTTETACKGPAETREKGEDSALGTCRKSFTPSQAM